MSKFPNCGWESVEPMSEATCRTCPWIIIGDLWPVCQNPDAAREGYQVDPGADSCDEHPACAGGRV